MTGTRHAKTGWIVLEDDVTLFNEGEWLALQSEYSLLTQTIRNGATIISQRCPVDSEFYYYGFDIPENRELVIFSYNLRVGQGAFDIDTIRAPAGFTGGTLALKHSLKSFSQSTVSTDVYCGAIPNVGDQIDLERDFVDTGDTIGNARTSSIDTSDGVLRIYRRSDNLMLRIKRLQDDPYTTRIRINAWERTI